METLQLTRKNGYAIVQLTRGKVNAINDQMVTEVRNTFQSLEDDDSIYGVILTGIPHYFSAGLDVIELYGYNEDQIRNFFINFGEMYNELLKFSKPFICAVTGFSPAGGTVIAITADYRIMAEGEKYSIGLNEMAVNVQISQKLVDGYSFWLGEGTANQFILDGKLLNPDEALSCGLVNEVCPQEKLLSKAEKKMQHYLSADPDIFKNTKYKIRKKLIQAIGEGEGKELEQALQIWWKPEVRNKIKLLIEKITKK